MLLAILQHVILSREQPDQEKRGRYDANDQHDLDRVQIVVTHPFTELCTLNIAVIMPYTGSQEDDLYGYLVASLAACSAL